MNRAGSIGAWSGDGPVGRRGLFTAEAGGIEGVDGIVGGYGTVYCGGCSCCWYMVVGIF